MTPAASTPHLEDLEWQKCLDCRETGAEDGASSNCSICDLINRGIERFVAGKIRGLRDHGPIRVQRRFALDSEYEEFRISLQGQWYDVGFFVMSDVLVQSLRKRCRVFSEGDPLMNQTMSGSLDTRLSVARGWLAKCRKDHLVCKVVPKAPKRLLQLNVPGATVVLREDIDASTTAFKTGMPTFRYACLSHCWGLSQPIRTTSSNIEDMKKGINSLPRTFQDAVQVALALDIPYLWIDSLCIIQDSEEDWLAQSRQMATIYGDAAVTIVASRARDSSTGFLDSPGNEAIPITSSTGITVWVRELFSHIYSSVDDDDPEVELNHIKRNPLDGRGWTFQEDLLSRRCLIFGHDEMFWICAGLHHCECGGCAGPRPETELFTKISALVSSRFGASLLLKNHFITPQDKFHTSWRSIVEHYSRRRLTFDKDRLVALNGIVDKLQDVNYLNATSHAGHWRSARSLDSPIMTELEEAASDDEEFFHTLCWMQQGRRPSVYRAPTWSWASIESDAGVTYTYERFFGVRELDFSVASVLGVDCPAVPLIDDPDLSRRKLTIRTLVFEARSERRGDDMWVTLGTTSFDGIVEADCEEDRPELQTTAGLICAVLAVRGQPDNVDDDPTRYSQRGVCPVLALVCKPSPALPQAFERAGLWILQDAPERPKDDTFPRNHIADFPWDDSRRVDLTLI